MLGTLRRVSGNPSPNCDLAMLTGGLHIIHMSLAASSAHLSRQVGIVSGMLMTSTLAKTLFHTTTMRFFLRLSSNISN